MTDLLELADKWRKESDDFGFACGNPYDVCMDGFMCADQLEAALAAYKWTKITEEIDRDISYRNIKWLVWSKDYGHEVLDGAVLMARLGDSFRPFNSLDIPPQESE